MNPSEAKTWKPVFSGEPDQISEISILIDGAEYQVYELDFEAKGHRILADFTEDFSE